ncbi:MAG: hypothetical protein ABIH34_04820 [Nanoarchaeota archaeon]
MGTLSINQLQAPWAILRRMIHYQGARHIWGTYPEGRISTLKDIILMEGGELAVSEPNEDINTFEQQEVSIDGGTYFIQFLDLDDEDTVLLNTKRVSTKDLIKLTNDKGNKVVTPNKGSGYSYVGVTRECTEGNYINGLFYSKQEIPSDLLNPQ